MQAMNDARQPNVNGKAIRHDREPARFRGSRAWIGLFVLGAVAAFFLLAEHRAHLFGALPYLLLVACPLMHVFIHRGHGRHANGHTPQRRQALAMAGPYARIRHPQYVAFVLILLGFLLQWPTLLTLAMFPVLLAIYARLAIREEAEMQRSFGTAFEAWAAHTPRFVPALRAPTASDLAGSRP